MHLRWITIVPGRHFISDTPLGMTLEVTRRSNQTWRIAVGSIVYFTQGDARLKDATAAKQQTEKLYCTAIRQEFERVCK